MLMLLAEVGEKVRGAIQVGRIQVALAANRDSRKMVDRKNEARIADTGVDNKPQELGNKNG